MLVADARFCQLLKTRNQRLCGAHQPARLRRTQLRGIRGVDQAEQQRPEVGFAGIRHQVAAFLPVVDNIICCDTLRFL